MSDMSPEDIIQGFTAYVVRRGTSIVYTNAGNQVADEQLGAMVRKYVGRLTTHHYNATGGQRYIDGRGFVNHCAVCDEPEGEGNHFHNPKGGR